MPSLGLSVGVPFFLRDPSGSSGGGFFNFLEDCGAVVGDYGQEGRQLLDNEVLSLNGTDQYASANIIQSGRTSFKFECVFYIDASSLKLIYDDRSGGDVGVAIFCRSSNAIDIRFEGGQFTGGNVSLNSWQSLIVEWDGSTLSCTINGSQNSITYVGNLSDSSLAFIGARAFTTPFNFFGGSIANAKITSNDTLVAQYDLQGNGLDASGNGNHLTLGGNPSFVVDNSGELTESDRVNSVGYGVGDGTNGADIGVIIPAHATEQGVDCFGNNLAYGSGYPAKPLPVESLCRVFNGVDQYVDTGLTMNNSDTSIEVSGWFYPNEGRNTRIAFSAMHSNADDFRLISISSEGVWRLEADDGSVDALTTTLPTDLQQWVYVEFGIVDGEMYFRYNGANELTRETSFNFSTINDGRITIAKRATDDINANCRWADAKINGVSIPFNNLGSYDIASDGTLVSYINNPTSALQDVVHRELREGFFKGVRGSGGRIDTGITSTTVTSMKGRFIKPPLSSTPYALMGCQDGGSNRFYVYTNANSSSLLCYIGSTTNYIQINSLSEGDEFTLEMQTNGDVYLNGALLGNTGGVAQNFPSSSRAGFLDRRGDGSNQPAPAILLQAWVNGEEVNIYNTSSYIGSVQRHHLVGYSELTNKATNDGHNDAYTKLNLTHLTQTGNTPPAITATGQDIQKYVFADDLVNPAFKREYANEDYEDRFSIFSEELTGDCLAKADEFFKEK
jgi:hypothetical protein